MKKRLSFSAFLLPGALLSGCVVQPATVAYYPALYSVAAAYVSGGYWGHSHYGR